MYLNCNTHNLDLIIIATTEVFTLFKLPAQSIMMDLQGITVSNLESEMLSHPLVGGLILFSRNFESSEQLKELITKARLAAGRPLLVAVDHEGGRVQRFKTDGFTHVPAMGKLLPFFDHHPEINAKKSITDLGWLLAAECLAHGIDLSFAPVLDLERGSDVIGDRAFSSNVKQTVELASYWCDGFRQAGMACVGKHFPGHGSTKADSHIAAPIDTRSFEQISENDMAVFKSMFDHQKLDAVMPAHVQFNQVDENPVGYSEYWLQTILKQQLKFDGIIFSDDLSMVGAGEHLSYCEKAQRASEAGCDMLLVCNTAKGVEEILNSAIVLDESITTKATTLVADKGLTLDDLQQSKRWQNTKALCQQIHNFNSKNKQD